MATDIDACSRLALDSQCCRATGKPWVICGISRSHWFKLFNSGRTPLPTARLGKRRPIYLIEELVEWLRAGAPDRESWLRMREARK